MICGYFHLLADGKEHMAQIDQRASMQVKIADIFRPLGPRSSVVLTVFPDCEYSPLPSLPPLPQILGTTTNKASLLPRQRSGSLSRWDAAQKAVAHE